MKPSNQLEQLGNCAARRIYDEFASAELSEAEDLGAGFVLQDMSDGESCSGYEINHLIQDCNTGRVAVFGEYYPAFWLVDVNAEPVASRMLLDQVRAASAKGNPMSVDGILAKAASAGITNRLEAETRSTLAINGHKFRLGCGCKTFYPDPPGPSG